MSDFQPPAGWFIDPNDSTRYRWWDGSRWTDDFATIPAEPTRADGPPVSVQNTVLPGQIAQAPGPVSADVLAGLDLPSDRDHTRANWVLAALAMAAVVTLVGAAFVILKPSGDSGVTDPAATAATSALPPASTTRPTTAPPTTITIEPSTLAPTTAAPTTSAVVTTTTAPPPECNQIVRPLPPVRFEDIGAVSAEAQNAVRWAEAVGMVALGDRQFRPADTMNRAEATTVLWRYFCQPSPGAVAGFTDVAGGFFTDAINWAAGKGIVSGKTSTTFDPGGALSRSQFVTMAWRSVGSPADSPPNPFTDSARGVFYTQALDWAFDVGLVNGLTPTTFAPDKPLDRLTVIVLFWRMENLVNPSVR